MIPEAIDQIIHHLLQHNFLNETRYAQAFARGKFRIKKWGKIRIVRELKFREISQYNITLALKEISETDYLQTFNELSEKKISQICSTLPAHKTGESLQKKRKKLADYLLYRGWESNLVYEKVKDLIN